MIRKTIPSTLFISLTAILVFCSIADAYWIWTPETKKFINPKYAVKDSPKEQYDWAMSFYNAKDYQRAAAEFEKLAKQYEFSEYASKAQYYVGLCYEDMNKYYIAYQNYQKAIDNFPHIANTEEILAREFAIGNIYLEKPGAKVLGTDIMAPLDRAVEIFKKVVENAPYGKYAEEAQFKMGEALKKSERYEEAVTAFHKIVEDYPNSKFATKAMYEESLCAYKASLRPAYDATATDNAIKTFEKFVYKNKDADLAKNADTTMKRLKDNVAEKSFKTAEFYESQGKKQAAIIYYQEVIDSYPESSFVNQAKTKIEALKSPPVKKVPQALKFNKKKAAPTVKEIPVAREIPKKPWKPLSFDTKNKPPAVKAETPRKKPWNLFGLGAGKETVKKEPVPKEAPKKPWKPLNFDTKRPQEIKKIPEAPIVETPVVQVEKTEKEEIVAPVAEPLVAQVKEESAAPAIVEAPKAGEPAIEPKEEPKKKFWTPFNFDNKKEPAAKDAPRKKEWKPLNFDAKKEVAVKESPKKPWKPLNFDNQKEPKQKKYWTPLYFGTNDEPMGKRGQI